ncbi:tRNA-splicing endonuclease subunit Sen15 isoform 3-T3 [Morphnus guianensis]
MATHPTFTEMMSLDISDSAQIYAAFVVYLDLLEGRNWHEVKHVGVAELQLVCLHAREREQDSLQVMVPVPVHISLSHERSPLIRGAWSVFVEKGQHQLLGSFVGTEEFIGPLAGTCLPFTTADDTFVYTKYLIVSTFQNCGSPKRVKQLNTG